MLTITLSLISHTNVGKTTLARTLLRRDESETVLLEDGAERAYRNADVAQAKLHFEF